MTKAEIYQFMNENPVFHLATMDGDQPRVRGMFLFRADENGIVFHTGAMKDVYQQILHNPKAELCFSGKGVQIRAYGELEKSEDPVLREEIFSHPSRQFLSVWKENGIDGMLQVFVLKNATAVTWTKELNFTPKEPINLIG